MNSRKIWARARREEQKEIWPVKGEFRVRKPRQPGESGTFDCTTNLGPRRKNNHGYKLCGTWSDRNHRARENMFPRPVMSTTARASTPSRGGDKKSPAQARSDKKQQKVLLSRPQCRQKVSKGAGRQYVRKKPEEWQSFFFWQPYAMKTNEFRIGHHVVKFAKVARKRGNVIPNVDTNVVKNFRNKLKSPGSVIWIQLAHIKQKSFSNAFKVMN